MRQDLHIASWNCERLTPYLAPKPVQLSLHAASQAASTRDLSAVFKALGIRTWFACKKFASERVMLLW